MTHYGDIDEIIGDYHKRYFGYGYKNVKYTVLNSNFNENILLEEFEIKYPNNWSIKSGESINAHFSTLDGIVLAVKTIEDYFINLGNNFSDLYLLKIEDLVIKAGNRLQEDLSEIRVELKLIESEDSDFYFKGHAGNFSVRIKINRYKNNNVKSPTKMNDYIFEGFKHSKINVSDVQISTHFNDVLAKYKIENEMGNGIHHGISNVNTLSDISILDGVIITAELTEALLLKLNDVDRDKSKLLIMRNIHFHNLHTEVYKPESLFHINVLQEKIIRSKNMRLMDCEASAYGFNLVYSIAQELGE